MRTKCDDCQFVLIKQNDYYEILNKSKENITRCIENGVLVMVTEYRPIDEERGGDIILRVRIFQLNHKLRPENPHSNSFFVSKIKGSVDKLLEMLIKADEITQLVDPTYIEDFLLTYRTFIESPTYITQRLIESFYDYAHTNNKSNLKRKVYRIVLMWITNHFNDFEINKELYDFLEHFQEFLQKEKMIDELRMVTIAISTKSKPRVVTFSRSKRDEALFFSIQGGWDKGYGIFISKIERDTKAHDLGLRKGDQIMEVNGTSFQHMTYAKALETLKSFTHLSIKLKYNPINFNEMLLYPEKSPYKNNKKQNKLTLLANDNMSEVNSAVNRLNFSDEQQAIQLTPRSVSKERPLNVQQPHIHQPTIQRELNFLNTKFPTHRFKRALDRLNKISKPKDDTQLLNVNSFGHNIRSMTRSPSPSMHNLNKIASTNTSTDANDSTNYSDTTNGSNGLDESYVPEHVLKIFKNDQTFKFLVVHKVS